MSIFLYKLRNVQVVINCLYSLAQICTRKDKLAYYLGPMMTSWVRMSSQHMDSFENQTGAQMVTRQAKYQTKWLNFKIVSLSRLFDWIWDIFMHFEYKTCPKSGEKVGTITLTMVLIIIKPYLYKHKLFYNNWSRLVQVLAAILYFGWFRFPLSNTVTI